MNDTDARLWYPWLRINRVLRVMLHTRWSAKAGPTPTPAKVRAMLEKRTPAFRGE